MLLLPLTRGNLTLDQQVALEDRTAAGLDVSTLVTPVGGVGTYPAMVAQSADLNWIANVTAHEWAHNYLTLRPLGINYLFGKDKKHYFEIGGGFTPVFNSEPDGDSAISESFGHLLLGYRFQPIEKGFTFRVFICPVYGSGILVPYYAGISGGYKF